MPLDKELETALFYRLDGNGAACAALFTPGSNRAKYCPECADCHEAYNAAQAQAETDGRDVTL